MRPLGTLLRVWLAVGLLLVGTAVHRCQGVDATINVTGTVAHPLSPMLYGVFFEEINFAGEGGLYAELVRNRDFEALGRGNLGDGKFEAPVFKRGDPKQRPIVTGAPPPVYTDLRPWYPVQEGEGATAVLSLDNTTHPFSTNPTTLKLVSDVGSGCSPAGQCGSGFGNPGYWGIGAVAGKNYKVSFYASTSSAKAVRYTARLVVPGSGNGNFRVIGSVDLPVFGLGWSQYSSFINPTESHSNAHLQILTAESNTAWFDSVSLFPEDAVLGLFRPELYAKLQELRPSFIRFPGGNYLEGSDLSTAWQWKRTLNQTEARPGHFNAAWGYWSTDGLGLYEYFLLCEALRAEPQMSIYTGYDLSRHYVPINQSQFIVQDAVDAVQYANGDPSFTRWGRVRSSNGHDRPFHMKRIEVGNEEYLMQDYAEHYQLITQAIWAKDPNMTVIASGRWGPSVDGSPCLTGQRCDLWDDHFYLTPDAMLQHSSWYDAYDRKLPKVFVGEYAANGNNDPGSLRAALAEAAFLMGLEQNGDAVLTSSFAPLFRNVNGSQWGYDLINFNSSALYTIPSFHVQKLFRSVLGDHVLQSAFSGLDKSVASVVLGKNNRTLVVKAVHYANFPITCDISLDPTLKPAAGTAATLTVLTSADPMDANSLNQPNKVVPVTSQITFNTVPYKLQVPAWSLFVLEVPLAA